MLNNIKFSNFYINEENRSEFFQFCIKNKLYREFQSHLKFIYTNEKAIHHDMICVIGSENNVPISIALCEIEESFEYAKTLKNPYSFKSDMEIHDWGFQKLGFVSLFVKKEFRNNGIGKLLVTHLENYVIENFNTKNNNQKEIIYVFEGQEKAVYYWEKYATKSKIIDNLEMSLSPVIEIHNLTQHILKKTNKKFTV